MIGVAVLRREDRSAAARPVPAQEFRAPQPGRRLANPKPPATSQADCDVLMPSTPFAYPQVVSRTFASFRVLSRGHFHRFRRSQGFH
jgi:hypothetical protein